VSSDLARVHRLEYPLPVHYACYAVWGAAYAVTGVRQLVGLPIPLAVVANLPLPVAMNCLNAAVDVRTDAETADKRGSAAAVQRLGVRRVVWWAAIEMAGSLALAVVVSVWLGRWLVALSVALIIALHVLYNVEPVRLKRRGRANPLTLGIAFGFLPCLVSYYAVDAHVTMPLLLIFAGLGATVAGRALWWMVPDRAGDAATGMTTLAVRYGARRTVIASCVLVAIGPVLLGWGLWLRYPPIWAGAGIVAGCVFLVGQYVVLPGISDRKLPSSVRLRRRNMTPMMLANVFLAALPMLAR
jgi:4-hydroxybenzoate polyprenyltransferase